MSAVDPFAYQPPTDEKAPMYAAIRAAEHSAIAELAMIFATDARVMTEPVPAQLWQGDHGAHHHDPSGYEAINRVCKVLHDVIQAFAPRCADRSTAERCARHARMLANEAYRVSAKPGTPAVLDVFRALRDARMWACAAIALDGAI